MFSNTFYLYSNIDLNIQEIAKNNNIKSLYYEILILEVDPNFKFSFEMYSNDKLFLDNYENMQHINIIESKIHRNNNSTDHFFIDIANEKSDHNVFDINVITYLYYFEIAIILSFVVFYYLLYANRKHFKYYCRWRRKRKY